MAEDYSIQFRYTNWRGETAIRTVDPITLSWRATEWHPEPGWVLRALDADKGETRDFALKDCDFTRAPDPAAERIIAMILDEIGYDETLFSPATHAALSDYRKGRN